MSIFSRKILKYEKRFNELGDFKAKLRNQYNIRKFIVYPLFTTVLIFSFYCTYIFRSYVTINIFFISISLFVFLYNENIINRYVKKWGVYKNGLCYKNGCVLFDNIPEIILISEKEIEVLNPDGIRENFILENTVVNNFKTIINFENNKIINIKWNEYKSD